MFALPNIRLQEAIEVDGFAVAPVTDQRVQEMSRNRRFRSFLGRFKTEFGVPVEPAVILWRNDKPDTYRTIAAISGFRDAIAMCVIPMAWALTLKHQRNMGPLYGDYFSFYPWMVDNQNKNLIVNRLATLTPHRRPILTPLRGDVCW
ncbi:hypothetical protein [Bradyrhizobium sp. LB13.1]